MNYIFGPVPSRRLGYSLGIDVIPHKTCTLDCVYCQLGKTTNRTLDRREWIQPDSILAELRQVLSVKKNIDYITFSGSGEPTLNAGLGRILSEIKKICSIPVAVITNGTLLYEKDVRNDLKEADLVVPSVDAATPRIFNRINRPHPDLKIKNIIEGLEIFSREFRGKIWLEVMVAKGVNDTCEELERVGKVLERVRMDKVQINTVTRPPAEAEIEPADTEILDLAKDIFGDNAEIIGAFTREKTVLETADMQQKIINLVSRHPDSAAQISLALGVPAEVVESLLKVLVQEKKITTVLHGEKRFYKA